MKVYCKHALTIFLHIDTGFSDSIWLTCVKLPNFSHSMVVEFLTTSKKRLPREVWMKNITMYITKCRCAIFHIDCAMLTFVCQAYIDQGDNRNISFWDSQNKSKRIDRYVHVK